MAVMRMLNCILKTRHSILPNTFPCLNIISNVQRNFWYSAKKPVIKIIPKPKKINFQSSQAKINRIFIGFTLLIMIAAGVIFMVAYQVKNTPIDK